MYTDHEIEDLLKLKASKLESLDYDVIDSDLNLKEIYAKKKTFFTILNAQRWLVSFLIGSITALLAVMVQQGERWITWYKFEFMIQAYTKCEQCFWAPFFIFIASNVALVSVASFLVTFVSRSAKGSGIPEIKSYLNGVKIPEIIRAKTLICKVVGVIFAVAGGLAVGKEGPMIHTGCVIAAGVSQGKSTTFPLLGSNFFAKFRNDTEKRDFVIEGAAAGVAAAFGAPIGGVLLTLEEGSSFWNQQLTWRTFFCAMVSTFTLNILLSGLEGKKWGVLSNPGLIDFGDFQGQTNRGYQVAFLPLFVILGVIGGLLGALFNAINKRLMQFRMRYIYTPGKQFLEAITLAALTAICAFTLSFFIHSCRKIEVIHEAGIIHFQYFCPEGYYNDMATIFCTTQESAIATLFHNEGYFSNSTLIIFVIVFFLLAILCCGIAVPAALFVPGLLLGAAYGRLFGNLISLIFPGAQINPGTFALIGAASSLGGIMRMTISLTVILMEATGDLVYGLPLMLTLMCSKWIGDWFNEGIYDTHIKLQMLPLLEWESPVIMRKYRSSSVMAKDPICFRKIESVGTIYDILKSTQHNGFPIISHENNLCGLILRSQLVTLLKFKPFLKKPEPQSQYYHKVQVSNFEADYPRFPNIETILISEADRIKFLDLTPYMHQTPYTIPVHATLTRVFRLFRTMGLRHLIVTDEHFCVKGMITRHDLAYFEEKLRPLLSVNEETSETAVPEEDGDIDQPTTNGSETRPLLD